MKMKFTFTMLAAVALAASCQTAEIDDRLHNGGSLNGEVIESFTTAGQITQTRLNIEESGGKIKKSWAEGDSLIGFVCNDSEFGYFTYKCTGFTEGGKAIWTRSVNSSQPGVPAAGSRLHLMYFPGCKASNFSDGTYTGSTIFKNQTDGSIPAVMCGSGTVDGDGEARLSFTNRMALLALYHIQLANVKDSTTINKITVAGVHTKTTLGYDPSGDSIVLTPAVSDTGIVNLTRDGGWRTGSDGSVSDTFFIALLPGTKTKDLVISAITDEWDYKCDSITVDRTIAAGNYLRIKEPKDKSTRIFKNSAVAEVTVDANTTEYSKFQNALNAANESENSTIKLLSDCTTDDVDTPITGTVTLDLNGHKLLSTATNIKGNNRIKVDGGNLTIQSSAEGGRIYQASSSSTHLIIVLSGTLTINSGTLTSPKSAIYAKESTEEKTVTINGGSISGNSPSSATIVITNGTLTVTGESTTIKSTDGTAVLLDSVAVANISGGQFESSADSASLILFKSTSTASKISGGTFSNTNSGAKAPLIYISQGKCTVSGGTFSTASSKSYLVRTTKTGSNYGKIDITGGCFNTTGYGFYIGYTSSKITVSGGWFYREDGGPIMTAGSDVSIKGYSVTGGNFNSPTISNVKFSTGDSLTNHSCDYKRNSAVKSGYSVFNCSQTKTVDGVNYTFSHKVGEVADGKTAAIGETQYATVNEAFKNAAEGDTIRLLAHSTLKDTVKITGGKSYVLDLNGKILTENAKKRLLLNSGNLTVDDCSSDGTIYQKATESNFMLISSGTLTLKRGVFYNSSTVSLNVNTNGKFIIEGGTVANAGSAAAIKVNNATASLTINDNVDIPKIYGTISKGSGSAEITAGYLSTNSGYAEAVTGAAEITEFTSTVRTGTAAADTVHLVYKYQVE